MAKKLAEFITILNKEDVSRLECQQEICKVSLLTNKWPNSDNILFLKIAEKNRNNYRKLRQELEDLTEKGVMMLYKVTSEQSTITSFLNFVLIF